MRPNRSPTTTCDVTRTARTRTRRSGSPAADAIAALATIAGVFASPSSAAAASRIVVVAPSEPTTFTREATTRVRAELAAAGFDAAEVTSSEVDARSDVERSEGDGTVATIALKPVARGTAIDVWVSDRVTGKSLVRRISVGAGKDAARIVAIRAIELLRASLLEATTPPPSPPPEAPPPPPPPPDVARWIDRTTRPTPAPARTPLVPSFAIAAGAAALIGVDGLGVAPMPELRVAAALGDSLQARLAVVGPGFIGDVSGAAGTAVVRQELARFELVYAVPLPAKWLTPTLAIGGGGYHLHARGDAAPTFRSSSDDAWAALVSAGAGAALRLSPHAAIVLDATAIGLAPRPVVVLGDARVASAGRPSVLTSFGVMATF